MAKTIDEVHALAMETFKALKSEKKPRWKGYQVWDAWLSGACATGSVVLFKILKKHKIRTWIVTGYYKKDSHAFNIVELNNKYYIVDTTFYQFSKSYKKKVNILELSEDFDYLQENEYCGYSIFDTSKNYKKAIREFFQDWTEQNPEYHWKKIIGKIENS